MKTSTTFGVTTLLMTGILTSNLLLAAGGANTPAQTPLFTSESAPPLNLLVMGRDHKLYYEAYNDASDLNGDGLLDVGYKGYLSQEQGGLDYYGYFNSHVCYQHENGTFVPKSEAKNKTCSGMWSGDYLNYLATSRMDALRKVLYGGYRSTDTAEQTILQAAYIPRDAHTWGKEYLSEAHDGYLISSYTPLSQPTSDYRHLFAVVSREQDSAPPTLRVLKNTSFRIWNWVSKESPVAEDLCNNSSGTSVSCTSGGTSGSGGSRWGRGGGGSSSSSIDDYKIQVEVCPSTKELRESNCKQYAGGIKPTGILHDFGESERMRFGLLTGSYAKNMSGGVLRANMGSFIHEVDRHSGQFCSSSTSACSDTENNPTPVRNGIVDTINKMRYYGYNYKNQNYGNCGWLTTRPMSESDGCHMWGNPVAEMMYEGLRYLAGASAATSNYSTSSAPDSSLGLPSPNWISPYAKQGSAYPSCSVPAMTVISDINPSFDSDLPGSAWGNTASSSGDPQSIQAFNAATQADAIGDAEGLTGKTVFIGESNGVADSAPTAKTISKLSSVRGLSPEEPSKQGTYYSAAVARFAANTAIGGDRELHTYAVALASPLPSFEFPVGNKTITFVPFAKSVSGENIDRDSGFQPTDQIVDFYVEQIVNIDAEGRDRDETVNGGRPYAKFRINYEDVEQGADHDMDAIAVYTLSVDSNNQLTVTMLSEYASGGIVQHMGYVISGTNRDGVYLEVKDKDTTASQSVAYKLDTPEGKWAGECANTQCSALNRLESSRTFTASSSDSSAELLNNPLWYAAKYGTPGVDPSSISGDPDNYFLVTNAATLKEQLSTAFSDLEQINNSVNSPSVSIENQTSDNNYIYRTTYDINTWSGTLIRENINDSDEGSWKSDISSGHSVKMANLNGDGLQPLTWDNLVDRQEYNNAGQLVDLQASLATDLSNSIPPSLDSEGNLSNSDSSLAQSRLEFILGASNANYRSRDALLGDIINSSPVLVGGAQYLTYLAQRLEPEGNYATFAATQSKRRQQVYLGANDGMLHGFDAATGAESFAFVPSAVIPELYRLTDPDYNEDGGKHHYYVDGTPVVSDIYLDNKWRTVLVGTLRAGGRSLFALDITDPDNIQLLWEFNQGDDLAEDAAATQASDMGYSFATPTLAKLHSGEWAVVTGNGYDSDSGRAVLLLINIANGQLLKKIPTAETDTDNGLSTVRVADNNSDGIAEYAYAGDLKGNLWRFDLLKTGGETPLTSSAQLSDYKVSFGGNPLYSAVNGDDTTQPITAPPSLVRHPSMEGYIVIFGTGRYFRESDKLDAENSIMQSIYGVWDKQTVGQSAGNTPDLTRSNLQKQSINTASLTGSTVRTLSNSNINWHSSANSEGKYGWYLDLATSNSPAGERIVDPMAARGEVLIATSRTPSDNACEAGLSGWTYAINPYTGGRTAFLVFDFDGDGKIDTNDSLGGQAISGIETPAGGFTLAGDSMFNTKGEATLLNYGPSSQGRQSWQLLSED